MMRTRVEHAVLLDGMLWLGLIVVWSVVWVQSV